MINPQVFSDADLKSEFLDRFSSMAERAGYAPTGGGALEGLESLESTPSVDDAAAAVEAITEGTWDGADAGLEAIIERFTRPVYLVQDDTYRHPSDDFDDSEFIERRLATSRTVVESVIPSVGRVDLLNHRKAWVGTGWMVAPDIVATNRHVAAEFASKEGDGFTFDTNFKGQVVEANIDWYHEHDRPTVARFWAVEVLWIEPKPSFDVALLRITPNGQKGEEQPTPIELATADDVEQARDRWVGVLGYPARDSRNDLDDQQRIFDGIYNVKRLSPGKITSIGPKAIEHDATTLGGASGGPVVDLETGRALAIHFGGLQGEENFAVKASDLRTILEQRVT